MIHLHPVRAGKNVIPTLEIAGTRAANSGSVDCVADGVPRSSKGGKCPPHLLKKRTDKEAINESVTSNEEVGVVKK